MHDTTRLLARHFFRRFLENDLISPESDRRQTLAVLCACVVSFGLLVTMLLAIKYLTVFPTPGQVSLLSLDDKFLYIGWSMGVMALVTLVEWDALGLDARDASILGPLPIPPRRIFLAKAFALLAFAGGCLAVLDVVPAVVFSSAMVSKLVVGPAAYLAQIFTHAAVTMAAGAFGFLGVLAAREVLHAALGTALFRRVSTMLQAGLVVFAVTWLCMMPGLSNRIGRSALAPERLSYAVPPLWFLGLYETGAGHVMDSVPRAGIPRRIAKFDAEATEIYRSRKPLFGRLAAVAVTALGLVTIVAAAAYTWNNRRLPPPTALQRGRSKGRLLDLFVRHVVARRPLARAGFFFAAQTLWRSGTHRLSMAASVAVALAFATVSMRDADAWRAAANSRALTNVLAVQAMAVLVLLIGFRHAARVPGDLRANWAFRLAWAGDPHSYIAGVKRAAFLCVVCPALLALVPLHVVLLGARIASIHLLFGVAFGWAALECAMLGFRTLPFAGSYVAGGNLKGWLAAALLGFWPLTHVVAALERIALDDAASSASLAALFGGIAGLTFAVRMFARWQREGFGPVDFHEIPAQSQRLDLGA